MTQNPQFIGVDVGTYETKAVLVDADGQVLATATAPHEMTSPKVGWAEHDANTIWWGDLVSTVQKLVQHPDYRADDLAAIGVSAIGPCVLPVDENLEPLRAGILYGVDTRSTAQIKELNERLGVEEIYQRSGNELTSQSAGPKIMWIRDEEPEVFKKTRYFLTAHSFMVAKLTGKVTIDHGTAGYYHPLYNLQDQSWQIDGCEDFVSLEQLPEIGWSTDIAGTVTAEAAEETGLPEGVPVTFGAVDAPAEAVSANVLNEGDLMLMYGSSTYMIQLLEKPIADRILWAAPFVFPDTYVLAAGTSTAGTLTHWISDVMGIGSKKDPQERFRELLELANTSPVGAKGLLLLPYFSGERTPIHDPHSRGILAGLTLNHTKADIARAVLEGVAHSAANALGAYDAIGHRPKTIQAVGGGTKNPIFIQTVSDITGHEQHIADTSGASFGDAALAALAIGHFTGRTDIRQWLKSRGTITPNAENQAILEPLHKDFQQLYQDTKQLMHSRIQRGETSGS